MKSIAMEKDSCVEHVPYDERQLLLQCIKILQIENAELRAIIQEDQKLNCTLAQNIWEAYWERCHVSFLNTLRMTFALLRGERAAQGDFYRSVGVRQ